MSSLPASNSALFPADSLVGTRWVAVGTGSNNRDTIDFADGSYCIYTSLDRSALFSYQVKGNRILLGDITSFVIRDNTLFIGGYPYFIRE